MASGERLNVALFCGGRGSKAVISEFLRRPNVRLTLLVNAYDDGLSTGALRDLIPGMLGPSDFRKNLSYLLDLHSARQYALQSLFEFRLPLDFSEADLASLRQFSSKENGALLRPPLDRLFAAVGDNRQQSIKLYLRRFFDYYDRAPGKSRFQFGDCSLGNLVFAGIYLHQGNSFNKAISVLGKLGGIQADLVNVSDGACRVLTGLKADGQLLTCEAEIVGRQTPIPILDTYFIDLADKDQLAGIRSLSLQEKQSWLAAHAVPTELSDEARHALATANVIVYGSGTQHSSLLPSYRIASEAILTSPATVRAFVANLHPDHDIQSLGPLDLVDKALFYLGDPENLRRGVTHVLYHDVGKGDTLRVDAARLSPDGGYKGAEIVSGAFANPAAPTVHSGFVVVSKILELSERGDSGPAGDYLTLFIDLLERSLGIDPLVQELLEIPWTRRFDHVRVILNRQTPPAVKLPSYISIERVDRESASSEVDALVDWIRNDKTGYLATITGDGEYRLRDVLVAFDVVNAGSFAAVLGSRTQSRRQFVNSLRAAYGESGWMRRLSGLGGFALSSLFALGFGVVFSDPLTGFRFYRRSRWPADDSSVLREPLPRTGTELTKRLLRSRVEIAEAPVSYRTFVGFTRAKWRFSRGVTSLQGFFR
jgi:2-phospho-L-lactate transferase/gluconeogenesis factor (CofD/UPF0052 family)